MCALPSPIAATTTADLRAFFDAVADRYNERHGPADRLLARRVRLLDQYAHFSKEDVVLDVGCGPGTHLHTLVDRIDRGIGMDVSPRMVGAARRHRSHPSLDFRIDDAEQLATIPAASVDAVICVGVLEHVLRPAVVLQQVGRVLRSPGRFVALTVNGTYWWYQLADAVGIPTRHLTTDWRLRPEQAERMLRRAGLHPDVGFWRFVPRGDLPLGMSVACRGLDALGERVAAPLLRGGLRLFGLLP